MGLTGEGEFGGEAFALNPGAAAGEEGVAVDGEVGVEVGLEEGVVFTLKGGPGAAYLCEGAVCVSADGEALVGLVWKCSEEGMDTGSLVVAELDEGGTGAVDMIGFKVS